MSKNAEEREKEIRQSGDYKTVNALLTARALECETTKVKDLGL